MQRAPDCDMVLVHNDDLLMIDEVSHDAVSEHLIGSRIVVLMLAVTRNA